MLGPDHRTRHRRRIESKARQTHTHRKHDEKSAGNFLGPRNSPQENGEVKHRWKEGIKKYLGEGMIEEEEGKYAW